MAFTSGRGMACVQRLLMILVLGIVSEGITQASESYPTGALFRVPSGSGGLSTPVLTRDSQRTSSAFVGSVMALLATFEQADVLPPEGTGRANQLIHALIQIQSVLLKSDSEAFMDYVNQALAWYADTHQLNQLPSPQEQGLSMGILEALLRYVPEPSLNERDEMIRALTEYNVSQGDWKLVEEIFTRADEFYRSQNSSIHAEYARWRKQMPGAS